MVKKTLEKSDDGIGLEFEVKKNTANANRIGFSSNLFSVGETVFILSEKERFDLMKQLDDYRSKIKELEDELATGSTDCNNEDLEKQIKQKDEMISDLAARIDSLEKELEENKSNPKVYDKDDLEELKANFAESETQLNHWKNSYETLRKSSDELVTRNEELIKENEILKTTNSNINETTKLFNDNLLGINDDYQASQKELLATYENNEKKLNETIDKQQSHIDELTEKLQSLSVLKEYIPPKQHYEELNNLKDNIKKIEVELDKANAEIDATLSKQKSEMQVKHTEEKAQMLLSYTQELNSYKLKYNELAKDFNHLLGEARSLSKSNVLFNGRHKAIVKDIKPVKLEEIEIEKKHSDTIEYVPKDNETLI